MFEKLLFNVMNNKFAYVCTRLTIVIFYKLHASVILFKFFPCSVDFCLADTYYY